MNVPYVGNDEILVKAEEFLDQFHPTRSLPVPIEEIVELGMGLVVIPILNLEALCEIDGSMSKDFKSILIDERTYNIQVDRARFTLAHEVGHFVLHKDMFMRANGHYNTDDFIAFQNNLSSGDYKRLEIQAHFFAEGILYPKGKFADVVAHKIDELGGVEGLVPADLEAIVQTVSEQFGVSIKAAFNKVRREFPSIVESAMSNDPF